MLTRNTTLKRGKSALKKSSGLQRKAGGGLKKKGFKSKKHVDPAGRFENLLQFFQWVWDIRYGEGNWGVDFETGKPLPPECRNNPIHFHHCLHKTQYEQYCYSYENIITVSENTHHGIHQNIDKYPITKLYTEELFNKHVNSKLK